MDYPLTMKEMKTARIPIRIKDGKLSFLYDETIDLSKLIVGEPIAEIIIPASSLKSPKLERIFNQEFSVEFFPQGTKLFCNLISANTKLSIKDEREFLHPDSRINSIFRHGVFLFAEVLLLEDLRLIYRGTKEPQLKSCICYIPALSVEAKSLNHAYTLLSQNFQKHRAAHTGNVYEHFHFYNYDKNLFVKIDILRMIKSGELNKQLVEVLESHLKND